jgi:RNA polymerase sigma factor (sigma-70 family)
MNTADSHRLLQHIRRLAGDPSGTPSDGELLQRYLADRDEAAFATLMRRHGPMVFSVCQSVLRQRDDAEDAFQAAFLILAQKAGSIRRHEGLGGWLQRVAYRVALKARADNLRRQKREAKTARSAADEPPSDELSWGELRSILHAELAALPEWFRAPLVLCYLEGRTQEEAARQLGWSLSTVRGRLQRGREKLRRRLERRGVALTAALGTALIGQTLAEAAVPSSALPTTAAIALARGFLRPLLPMKLAILSALMTVSFVAGGMALRSPVEPRPSGSGRQDRSQTVAAEPETVDAHGDPLPDGAIARLGTVRFNHGNGLNALFFSSDGKKIFSEGNGSIRIWDAKDGKEQERMRTAKTHFFHDPITLLADGQTFITLLEGGDNDVAHFYNLARKIETHTRKLPVKRRVFSAFHANALSPDGKLALSHVHTPQQVQVSDLTTGKHLYQLAKGDKEFLAATFAGNDRIVSGDKNQHLEVWEARTGKLLHQVNHEAAIGYLLASPDGRWLASLTERPSPYGRNVEQEIVYLWDMSTGKVMQSLRAEPKYWFTNICFSPDGRTVLTSTRCPGVGDQVVYWDRHTGQKLLTFAADSGVVADITAISPDGSRLAAGDLSGKFDLWDLKRGRLLTTEDSRHLRYVSIVLAPNGEQATIIGQQSISSWDARSGRRLHSFHVPRKKLISYSVPADGRYAVTFQLEGEEFHILIWDIVARKILHTLRFPGGYQQITSAFSPASTLLATWHPGEPTVVHLWDVRSGKQVRSFEEKKAGGPGQMAFTADGKTLFVAGKKVAAYEVASGKELFSWRLKPLPNTSGMRTMMTGVKPQNEDEQLGWSSLAVSPDGTHVAAIMHDFGFSQQRLENRLALYDAHSGKLLRRWNDSGLSTGQLEHMAFSQDGQLLASSDGHVVHLWETATTKLIHTFKGHQSYIHALAFSRDGRRLASSGYDSTVLIWDVTGQPAKEAALTEAMLKECWNDLASEDAGRAHRAVWTLIRAPRESIPFLKTKLHPVKSVGREQIDQWVRDLDAGAFQMREQAKAELEKLGVLAEPALRRALANKPTLEQRRRIEPLLAKLKTALPTGETLKSLRAVRVLEHAATPEARQVLGELAGGAEGAWLTREAKAALTRTGSTSSGASP